MNKKTCLFFPERCTVGTPIKKNQPFLLLADVFRLTWRHPVSQQQLLLKNDISDLRSS